MAPLLTCRLVALLLAAVITAAPLATCLIGTSSDDEMACCVKGTQDCLPGAKGAECCAVTPAQVGQQATVTGKVTPLAQVAAVEMLPAVLVTSIAWQPHPYIDGLSPPGSKHPTYLLLSTFRL